MGTLTHAIRNTNTGATDDEEKQRFSTSEKNSTCTQKTDVTKNRSFVSNAAGSKFAIDVCGLPVSTSEALIQSSK